MTLFYLFESTLRKSNSHAFQSLYFVFFFGFVRLNHMLVVRMHTQKNNEWWLLRAQYA